MASTAGAASRPGTGGRPRGPPARNPLPAVPAPAGWPVLRLAGTCGRSSPVGATALLVLTAPCQRNCKTGTLQAATLAHYNHTVLAVPVRREASSETYVKTRICQIMQALYLSASKMFGWHQLLYAFPLMHMHAKLGRGWEDRGTGAELARHLLEVHQEWATKSRCLQGVGDAGRVQRHLCHPVIPPRPPRALGSICHHCHVGKERARQRCLDLYCAGHDEASLQVLGSHVGHTATAAQRVVELLQPPLLPMWRLPYCARHPATHDRLRCNEVLIRWPWLTAANADNQSPAGQQASPRPVPASRSSAHAMAT